MFLIARQAFQRARQVPWREFTGLVNGQPGDHFGQRRARGNAGRTALNCKTRLSDFAIDHFDVKAQQIAANRIGRLAARRRGAHFADVAGIFQMFENLSAVHFYLFGYGTGTGSGSDRVHSARSLPLPAPFRSEVAGGLSDGISPSNSASIRQIWSMAPVVSRPGPV